MVTALQLISPRVVVGRAGDKLPDVAGHLVRIGTHHLVVLGDRNGELVGIVRLADIAWRSNASTRILADLVSSTQPVTVGPGEPAATVCALFVQHRLGEVAVLGEDGRYLGLITNESALEWSCAELKRTQQHLQIEGEALRLARAAMQVAATERERYLANLSHTLRSPLNPVLLIASARAENPNLPEDVRRDFRTIAQNVAFETKVIDDLIDSARTSRQRPPAGA